MGSRPDLVTMVGRLFIYLVVVIVVCTAQEQDCDEFKQEYCNLSKNSVLMVDTKISGLVECQTACFEKRQCTQFSYFPGGKRKCVLFKSCERPKSSCENCISGPAFPRVSNCLNQAQQDRRRKKESGGNSRRESTRSNRTSG